MKTKFLLLIYLFLFNSCSSQDKKSAIVNDDTLKVEFYFYPSSGGNSVYNVVYENGIVKVKNNENVNNNTFNRKFTEEENKEIIKKLNYIKVSKNITTEIILDSWRIELKIDSKIFYNKSGIKIKDLPDDIKILLNMLIKDSKVKIDLYDFS